MTTPEDVKKLAALARITLPEDSLEKFTREFDSILAYVDQLNSLTIEKKTPLLSYVNRFREDENPHEAGKYTTELVEQFPARDGDYLVVKKIIAHD